MFSEISKNWAGQPLRDHETILNCISTTHTKTGLRVDAHLVQDDYPTGVEVSDNETDQLAIRRHDTQPARNYTISPSKPARSELGTYCCASTKQPWGWARSFQT